MAEARTTPCTYSGMASRNPEDPELFSCITTQMIHGPCGVINPFSPCMKDGRCTERYPRDFLKETQTVARMDIHFIAAENQKMWMIFNTYQSSTFRSCS
ncbi:hypothetical protein TNIN_172121 [Trichonephila inaurata madagascariensis]|uniref:Uncharacterized protein n=1 Tax=Trichonephila inaurata madagascariensis TaxID=2747483 RepID=A0A8X6XL38_9ARAC|nr:hypothetical protein TNIN_172121 [Trichonephila inaurata madagascariensis]